MWVKIEDLRIGDEVLWPSQTTFKKLKIINLPKKDTNGNWKATICAIPKTSVASNFRPNHYWSYYDCMSDDYNSKIRLNLDERPLWLINRQ